MLAAGGCQEIVIESSSTFAGETSVGACAMRAAGSMLRKFENAAR